MADFGRILPVAALTCPHVAAVQSDKRSAEVGNETRHVFETVYLNVAVVCMKNHPHQVVALPVEACSADVRTRQKPGAGVRRFLRYSPSCDVQKGVIENSPQRPEPPSDDDDQQGDCDGESEIERKYG
ncbi:hypothetical protein [Variovorax paradoxus]|uniref:hypothetical protein n=1 Tax=Variovorax paradoxus TaxID=34073 RepID=UPI0012DABB3B|nr:hypothetical protein [Variovorax paradoxus]